MVVQLRTDFQKDGNVELFALARISPWALNVADETVVLDRY